MPITISGSGTISGIVTGGLPDRIVTFSGIAATTFASVTEMTGISTTGVTTDTSSAVTLTGTGATTSIFNGDYVSGAGIAPGTIVSSGGGTADLVLSNSVGLSSAANPLTFYSANKIVTEGVIGGQLCRAWVNFDGTSTVAIRASYNVSSITDNGTGDYTVTFTTAMPDTNFCPVFGGQATSDIVSGNGVFAAGEEHTGAGSVTTRTTSTLRMWTKGPSGVRDNPGVFVAVFR